MNSSGKSTFMKSITLGLWLTVWVMGKCGFIYLYTSISNIYKV